MERKKIAMLMAEFLGTAILTAVILAVSKSNLGVTYFVSLTAGLALAVSMLVFAPISGAHLNPAITIGLWTARRIKALPALTYIAAQLFGGYAAYLLFTYLVDTTLVAAGEYDSRILVAEAAGAFVLSLAWAAAVYNKLASGKTAFVVGAAFTVGMVVASVASVQAVSMLNPAVALGMRSWVWGTYVLGPILGAVIGFNLYALLFAPAKALLERGETTGSNPTGKNRGNKNKK